MHGFGHTRSVARGHGALSLETVDQARLADVREANDTNIDCLLGAFALDSRIILQHIHQIISAKRFRLAGHLLDKVRPIQHAVLVDGRTSAEIPLLLRVGLEE